MTIIHDTLDLTEHPLYMGPHCTGSTQQWAYPFQTRDLAVQGPLLATSGGHHWRHVQLVHSTVLLSGGYLSIFFLLLWLSMRKVQSEFSVQSTTKKILIDNHFKYFTDQSEMSALPLGY